MSGSAQGEIPELGKTRSHRSARNRITLNDAFGNLLHDENESLSSNKTIENKKSRKEEDAEFYRQLAADANTHLEEDENSSVLAASVNIDDLEGNLFGSLSRKQKKSDTTKSDAPEKGISKSTIAEAEKRNLQSESKCDLSILKSNTKPGLDDDDLLDLLGGQGGEDVIPSRKSKPKFTLTAKRTGQNSVAKCNGEQMWEQPKANLEMPNLSDVPNKDKDKSSEFVHARGADNEGKADEEQFNKLDDMAHTDGAIPLDTSLLPMETLNDNESKRGSRFDELLGVNNALGFMTRENKLLVPSDKTFTMTESTGEDQYGTYHPSVISKFGSQKSRTIISRKGGDLDNEASLLRPVTAPEKMSVKFAEMAQSGNGTSSKPNKSLENRVIDHSISEKDKLDTEEGQESVLSHSTPGQLCKSINSDIATDGVTDGSQQQLGRGSQKQSKHFVFPWQDTGRSVVVKKQATHQQESLKQNDTEKRYREVTDMEMEDHFRINEKTRQLAAEECTAFKAKICELENDMRKFKLDMAAELDDLNIKLHRVMAERDELQLSLDSCKKRLQEEMEAIQKENGIRLRDMEEFYQRRLARFQEDIESERSMMNEKIVGMTKEKNEQEIGFKKKIESLEIIKNTEVSNVKENYRVLVEDLKREHELDIQHHTCLHQQEIEALRNSTFHCRALTELAQHVEVSMKEVDQLHLKIDQAHSKGLEQREQTIRVQQEHLKGMEQRLTKQQLTNDVESEKLQKLIIKLEAHISQQSWQIEQERWQIQQEAARIKAREMAFEEERSIALKQFRQGQEELQKAKEALLIEQKSILTQCFEEKRRLEAEKAEFSRIQRMATEQEQKDAKRYLTAEVDLSTAMACLKDEKSRICNQHAELKQQQERVMMEQKAVQQEKEQLDVLSEVLHQKLKEIENIEQTALVTREYGEKCLNDALKNHSEIVRKTRSLHLQADELQKREQALSKERIALIQESRELQLRPIVKEGNCSKHVLAVQRNGTSKTSAVLADAKMDMDSLVKKASFGQSTSSPPLSSSNSSTYKPYASQDMCHYKSIHQPLTQLKRSICVRQATWQAINVYFVFYQLMGLKQPFLRKKMKWNKRKSSCVHIRCGVITEPFMI